MFNSKKIKDLELDVKALQDQVWQLQNPAKHKVGEKYAKGQIITGLEFKPAKVINLN